MALAPGPGSTSALEPGTGDGGELDGTISGHRSALRVRPCGVVMTPPPIQKAPPFDPELAAFLKALPEAPVTVTLPMIPAIRETLVTPPETVIGDRPIVFSDRTVPGPPGGADLTLTMLERSDRRPGGPAIYYIHGGGMIVGDRWMGTGAIVDWVDDLDALVI